VTKAAIASKVISCFTIILSVGLRSRSGCVKRGSREIMMIVELASSKCHQSQRNRQHQRKSKRRRHKYRSRRRYHTSHGLCRLGPDRNTPAPGGQWLDQTTSVSD
jgi:hypothetical protein